MQTIKETNFKFEGQQEFYRGKVRDVYIFEKQLVIVASDRISAFDVILPEAIPCKGQVLSQVSAFFMQETASLVPNWVQDTPDPNVTVGIRCEALPVEMIMRGHLAGSAWRAYKNGQREFNGQKIPDGLRENDLLPFPVLTPSTKAEQGLHDEDISTDEIIRSGLISKEIYEQVEAYTKTLFRKGREIAQSKGLILADTKYEFGVYQGKVYLIDELHTPDSSRYFDAEGFEDKQDKGIPQLQRSKEMVRQWLLENGFKGDPGQKVPAMNSEWIQAISREYIALYEQLTGKKFVVPVAENRLNFMQQSIAKTIVS